MYKVKSDFLKECMSDVGQGPIDIFQKAFCSVCANRDCSRSTSSNLSFDRRVSNWKDDLFNNVPRANESDPNFARIRAKRFISLDNEPSGAVSNAVPIIIETQKNTASTQVEASIIDNKLVVQMDTTQMTQTELEFSKQEQPTQVQPIQAQPIQAQPQPVQVQPVQVQPVQTNQPNTVFVQGTTIPGFKKEETTDIMLEPGASFTFGGSDER